MATQRKSAATVLGQQTGNHDAVQQAGKSDITPAVPFPIIAKLLGFTFAMITLPISAYFVTRDRVFSGNTTYAGATAAVVANVVLLGYIVVAFAEDQSERTEAERRETKKRR